MNDIREIVELDFKMIDNKKTTATTVIISVKHIKNESSKTKCNDYLERNNVSFTKLVGKTHISSFMCLGKKNKKYKKNKKR